MKLVRFGAKGSEKPGFLDADGAVRDLSGVIDDIVGDTLSDPSLAKLRELDPGSLPKVDGAIRIGPIGPCLVTRDDVPEPQNLKMYLEVNGHRYQDGSTKTMHFDVATVISHLSQFMSRHPGDVISTGAPPGVGMGQKPPTYLKSGDVMHLGIDVLGVQTQTEVAST